MKTTMLNTVSLSFKEAFLILRIILLAMTMIVAKWSYALTECCINYVGKNNGATIYLLPPKPILNFSDITSGAKTGLNDGLGSGAIITIWGNNLGITQGSSKIYIDNEEAAHVYYWGDADGSSAAGPSNLIAYHKMQTISFSVPSTVSDGLVNIHVEVDGETSNKLPFTIRSGNMYFVSPTGSDSNNGSWSSPWATLDYVGIGSGGILRAGDIVYAMDGTSENNGLPIRYLDGTSENPFSIIAYPGADVLVENSNSWGIGNHNGASSYWNFSKIKVATNGNGIDTFVGMRVVAMEITNYPGGCANGQGGAISGSNLGGTIRASNIKAYGNYIHDYGCDTTSKLHHVFYISNRSGTIVEAFELGWNHLSDNKAHHALHIYDEGICGDFSGTVRVHNNVVINQVGVGVGISSAGYSDTCFTMPVEIYNNLFVNVGREIPTCNGNHTQALSLMRRTTRSHVKVYNNTFFGYGEPRKGYAIQVQENGHTDWNFGGTWEFVNNIIVDTNDLPFEYPQYWKAPDISGNNLWYDPEKTINTPIWDNNYLTTNPLFIELEQGNFNLENTSPAIDAGSSIVSSLVAHDIIGNPRPLISGFDIGAFEFNNQALNIIEYETEGVLIFPNPTNNHINLEYSGTIQVTKIELIDMAGKVIRSFSPESRTLNINTVSNGTYVLKIQLQKNNRLIKKIIILK